MLKSIGARTCPDIPADKVTAFNTGRLLTEFTSRLRQKFPQRFHPGMEPARQGQWFARRVARDLAKRSLRPDRDVFFGFSNGCLETLQFLQSRGVPSILDQFDADKVHEDMVAEEADRWPDWVLYRRSPRPQAYWERRAAERELASLVLVNSQWTKSAMLRLGVPEEKIVIVPLAYDPRPDSRQPHVRGRSNNPLVVLALGTVSLSKGVQYLVQAARLLSDTNIQFLVVGHRMISGTAIASAPKNMQFLGPVPRHEVERMYERADLFVLPTISDGFAITQLEAMSRGLPVIATTNCARVVCDGIDGHIIPARDAVSLARAIAALDKDRDLLGEMSIRATEKARQFTVDEYYRQIEQAVQRLRA